MNAAYTIGDALWTVDALVLVGHARRAMKPAPAARADEGMPMALAPALLALALVAIEIQSLFEYCALPRARSPPTALKVVEFLSIDIGLLSEVPEGELTALPEGMEDRSEIGRHELDSIARTSSSTTIKKFAAR